MKHKEIPNRGYMPQTYMTTGYITLKLCQLNASRTMIIEYKNHEKNQKHSCKTNPWRKCKRKHHVVPENLALVTNTTKDRLQNMYPHPQMLQRKVSIIPSKYMK